MVLRLHLYSTPPVRGAEGKCMLWTIAVILLMLWLLGFSLKVMGGLIHILLVVALIIMLMGLLTGRRRV
jgi:hypothetical protein